mgnify:CR=1 FL=1
MGKEFALSFDQQQEFPKAFVTSTFLSFILEEKRERGKKKERKHTTSYLKKKMRRKYWNIEFHYLEYFSLQFYRLINPFIVNFSKTLLKIIRDVTTWNS